MKTQSYNPSPLEVEIAQILHKLTDIVSNQLKEQIMIKFRLKAKNNNKSMK